MAAGQEKRAAIAEVWAESLIALAAEAGREDEILEQLEGLAALLDREPVLDSLLTSPLTDQESKRQLLEKALRGRAGDLLVDALQVMRRKGRLDLLRSVARAFRASWLERRHRIEVRVVSAVPLPESSREALKRAAARLSGSEPILVERLDPSLLGGLVVSIGDRKFDGSVVRELGKLEQRLLARASRELLSGKSYVTEVPSSSSQGDVSP